MKNGNTAHDKELFVCEFRDAEKNYHPVYFFNGMVKPEKEGENLFLAPQVLISTETTYGRRLSSMFGTKSVIKSMPFYKKVMDGVSYNNVSNSGSVVGAAVAGAVVAGPTGAVVGAIAQASKNASNTVTKPTIQYHIQTTYYPCLKKGSSLFYQMNRIKIRKDIVAEMGRNDIGNGRYHTTDDIYYVYELEKYYHTEASMKEISEKLASFLIEVFEKYSK